MKMILIFLRNGIFSQLRMVKVRVIELVASLPIELFEWSYGPNNLQNKICKFSPEIDYHTSLNDLNNRFAKTKPIAGTQ